MTCWRRLRDWNDAGVWTLLHENLLAELHVAGVLDWSRAVIDGSHLRAMKGGPKTGPSRWEIRDDIHVAFLRLACAIICLRRLTSLSPY